MVVPSYPLAQKARGWTESLIGKGQGADISNLPMHGDCLVQVVVDADNDHVALRHVDEGPGVSPVD